MDTKMTHTEILEAISSTVVPHKLDELYDALCKSDVTESILTQELLNTSNTSQLRGGALFALLKKFKSIEAMVLGLGDMRSSIREIAVGESDESPFRHNSRVITKLLDMAINDRSKFIRSLAEYSLTEIGVYTLISH
jgi:hypothetical protein